MSSKTKIVSIILLFSAFMMFVSCGSKQDKVERYMEDGVEVILNHLEPYKIKGEPSNLLLEEELLIDMESKEIEETGLVDIDYFDNDSEGNIYVANIVSTEPKYKLVLKFDRKGKFISSFGRKGQGPGEVQFVLYFGIDSRDRIIISDHINKKVLFFSKDGGLIKERAYGLNFFTMFPLENEKYLFERYLTDLENKRLSKSLRICNSKFEGRKELDTYLYHDPSRGVQLTSDIFKWRIFNKNIYAANDQRGYEILMYDLDGNLKRKIKKKYTPLKYPEDLKKRYIERYGTTRKIYFPDNLPPFQSFFGDDDGRLFVMTYEKGEKPGEYVFDIFNSEGVFVQRKNLIILNNWELQAKAKRGYLYCVREKENGYKELVVYKMTWE
jgi:hypothetical protein